MDSLGHPLSSVAIEPSSFTSTALPVESATHLMASAFSHDPFRVARPYPTNPGGNPQLAVDTTPQRSAFRPIATSSTVTPTTTASSTPSEGHLNHDRFITMALNMLVHQNEHGEGHSSGDGGSSTDSASSATVVDPTKASLLCQICSDRASGFHYGVFACEGCKGFFRRSIQQKIQYRPCSKSQQCAIVRNNRNRCQYCRLKKCVSVGMSRDAVRFGRVPKREKVKMVEEMQRASVRSSIDALAVCLEDEVAFVVSIERGFSVLGEFIRENTSTARKFLDALPSTAVSSTTKSECPLEAVNHVAVLQAMVEFSKSVPGFQLLHVKDSVHLLKASLFQVLLLRLASMLKPGVERATSRQDFMFLASGISGESGRFLHDSVGDFVQRFRLFELNERKMAIFAAYVMVQPDNISSTSHYHHAGLVKMLQDKLYDLLIRALCPHDSLPAPFCAFHHVNNRLVMDSIHAVLTDLKTLHTLHQERLQAIQFPMGPASPCGLLMAQQQQMKPLDMPCLRRALQQPAAQAVGSFVDRHRTVADALSRPPPPQAPPKRAEDAERQQEQEEEEQPLNLCIRKV